MFQDFRLLDHLSAFENVALPLRLSGGREEDYRQDVEELLTWVGLGDRMQARPPTLSGGEQQRVAIARAVVGRPDLLLADEPTGNVDPEIGQRLIRLFSELNRLGTTVLIATHDRGLIEKSRAKEMRLVDGRLVELRTPTKLSARRPRQKARILPREKGAAPLDLVIAVMAFLAAIALGAALARQPHGRKLAGRAWPDASRCRSCRPTPARRSRRSSARPTPRSPFCNATPGIVHAAPLSQAEALKLVEPWLGKGALVADLPLPRLIDAAVLPGARVDIAGLAADAQGGRARFGARRSQPLAGAAEHCGRHGDLVGLWHSGADRRGDGGDRGVRDARGPSGPSRDRRAAAPDGRPLRASSPGPSTAIIS